MMHQIGQYMAPRRGMQSHVFNQHGRRGLVHEWGGVITIWIRAVLVIRGEHDSPA